jgi:hypothetical protein
MGSGDIPAAAGKLDYSTSPVELGTSGGSRGASADSAPYMHSTMLRKGRLIVEDAWIWKMSHVSTMPEAGPSCGKHLGWRHIWLCHHACSVLRYHAHTAC